MCNSKDLSKATFIHCHFLLLIRHKQKKSPYGYRNKILFAKKDICFLSFISKNSCKIQDRGYTRGMGVTSRSGRVYLKVGARRTPEGLMAQINYTYFR